ncbi:MAG: class I SAM-dependent methyltransferase [Candidatus Beckwithbacteria bacterium]|nr:class I SAM-dependent methyltransferase [Candidatus Beckwithbacteria bacterium]
MSQSSDLIKHRKKYSQAIKASKKKGMAAFQAWFDKSKDINESIKRGYWDLTFHILTQTVCRHLNNPEEKIALEIGYGGGRILNAACSYFKQVVGIDIHEEKNTVIKFLTSQGKTNFKLLTTSGCSIAVASDSLDFIYSFIVLQHLPNYENLTSYLKETRRCLKVGGVAQLYFGKFSKLNPLDQIRFFLKGYKEITTAPVNQTSLVIRVSKMKQICRKLGFKILATGTSYKNVSDGSGRIKGGQNFITLLK